MTLGGVDPMIDLVDDTRLKAVGYVPRQSAPAVGAGQPVGLRLLDGRTLEGQVGFISKVADAKTRSFRIATRRCRASPGSEAPAGRSEDTCSSCPWLGSRRSLSANESPSGR